MGFVEHMHIEVEALDDETLIVRETIPRIGHDRVYLIPIAEDED